MKECRYNVLHPMGFDSFGLPAEQFAIQTGHHPAEFTKKNIDVFRKQIKSLGFSYDWDRELQQVIQSIINGHNGSLQNYMIKD